MTNPRMVLSRFRRSHGTNYPHLPVTAPLIDEHGLTIEDYMVDAIRHVRHRVDAATYWSFAEFSAKEHKVEAIVRNTAVVLEYPLSYRADLETALAQLGYAHWIVGTEQQTTNHLAIIFPTSEPIENPLKAGKPANGRYNRVAAMLRDELHGLGINKEGLTDGSTSRTFLVQPYSTAVVEG